MRFYLIKKRNILVNFRLVGSFNTSRPDYVITGIPTSGLDGDDKVTSADLDPNGLREDLCDKLTAVFQNQKFYCLINMKSHCDFPVLHDTDFRININSYRNDKTGKLFGDILGGSPSLQVSIRLKGSSTHPFITECMNIPDSRNRKTLCVDPHFNQEMDTMLKSVFEARVGQNTVPCVEAEVTVWLTTPEEVPLPDVHDKLRMNKRILMEKLTPDVVIVCENEAEVKCHRTFLVAHSDMFKNKFESEMKEKENHRINMVDVSEAAVEALLAYLYHWDLSKAEDNCAMCVELLRLGHEYLIKSLMEKTRNILLFKPDKWYTGEVGLHLYTFIIKVEDLDEEPLGKKVALALKKRAVLAMTQNVAELKDSPTYKMVSKEVEEEFRKLFEFSLSLKQN